MSYTEKYNYYNNRLKPYANKLRKEMTKAEACLWKYALKGKNIKGYQFRRQRPILNYIADFACLELKLVIEIDGITHHYEETYLKDIQKENDLKQIGFEVIRFTDEQVLKNMDGVILSIENKIKEIEEYHLRHSTNDTSASGG